LVKSKKPKSFIPFENEGQVFQLGTLSVENGTEQLKLYGAHNFDFSLKGLEDLQALQELCAAGIKVLESARERGALPNERNSTLKIPTTTKNPFN